MFIDFGDYLRGPGYVYLAQSDALALLKGGLTGRKPDERARELCEQGYAGAFDWRIVHSVFVANMKLIETRMLKRMQDAYAVGGRYRDPTGKWSKEIFQATSHSIPHAHNYMRIIKREHGIVRAT